MNTNISFKHINKLAVPALIAGIAEPILSITDTAIIGNKIKEPFISLDNYLYNRSVKKGRREQVKIKELFLKGHASSLATKVH